MIGQVALEEAVRWLVPAVLTLLGGWWLVKRKKLAEWREARRVEKAAFSSMVKGWGHMHDTVGAIAEEVRGPLTESQRRTEVAVREQGVALNEMRAILRAQSDLSDDGAFQCTPTGSNTLVNLAYARMIGVGKADLLGNQWKNYIAPQDAAAFLAANAAALAEHRPFNGRCHMVRSDGDLVLVDVTMYPDPERPPAERWFGKIREAKQ